jgi:type I pantothenate kinase
MDESVVNPMKTTSRFSPYVTLQREEWRTLRASTPLPLSEEELERLRSLNDRISLDEVREVYLPLSRLLNLYVAAKQNLYVATNAFLGNLGEKVPFIIGIAGSVAVGKSTTARIIQTLLARWPNHPKVDLVTTDGFLYPNRILEERGIMNRKGFPESYDVKALIRFLADVKSGKPEVHAPVYSHLTYDIVPGESIVIRQPDIVIVEGLNVLQTSGADVHSKAPRLFVSDFFDFSIYVDAKEEHIQNWYVERFQALRETAFRDKTSFFHRFSTLTDEEAVEMALRIWREINGKNLAENILPTRERADLILEKGEDHSVQRVRLRKL